MTPLHHPAVQRWLRGHLLCHVSNAGPRFALTFDDGPSPRNTPTLLDGLGRLGAHATFFVLAGRSRRHPKLVERIASEGHEIGIHGAHHVPAWSLPRAWLEREIDLTAAAVRDACGTTPRHYRAPFGLMFPTQAAWVRERGLTPVLGDIHPRDHARLAPEPIVREVVSRLEPGAIVILHDSSALGDPDRGATIAAVPAIVAAGASRGLRSVTVEALLGGAGAGAGGPESAST